MFLDALWIATCWIVIRRHGRTPLIYWLATLPGTLAHELAHFVAALLLKGRPRTISLVPRKQKDGSLTLGAVTFEPRWWNGAFIALAPLAWLPAAWLFTSEWLPGQPLHLRIPGGYLIACLLANGWPSAQDWRVALEYPAGLVVILAVITGLVM